MSSRLSTLAFALCLALSACGGGSTPSEPNNTNNDNSNNQNNNNNSNSNTTYSCCLNNAFYACADKAGFDLCAGGDPLACHDACDFSDFDCHMKCDDEAMNATHDPSKCTRNTAKDGQCSIDSGSCMESISGKECSYSTQCDSGNCTKGRCYPNTNGSLCTYSTQCSSGNCTDGCCRGNSVGASCTYSTQCDSGNCTDGRCSGNSLGSACTYSTQCTSGSCVNGRCQ